MLEKSNKDDLPPDLVGIDVLFPLVGWLIEGFVYQKDIIA